MKMEEKHTPFSRKVFGSEHERNKEENRETHNEYNDNKGACRRRKE